MQGESTDNADGDERLLAVSTSLMGVSFSISLANLGGRMRIESYSAICCARLWK